ncbi:hypothetical protein AWC38_SpisGene22640 [Stylophora pistillata]|uniref:Uncharacterized protein n=1 Tax=Stylophora pistillata TaxID=50429 RepID=A0A2B4RAA0_STYPI|nr:hypothetical protein AWC38_SpisGene22640 [Stylophora pistillata]
MTKNKTADNLNQISDDEESEWLANIDPSLLDESNEEEQLDVQEISSFNSLKKIETATKQRVSLESSSEDCRDSGFETCNTSQGSSRNQTDPLLIGSITRSPEPWHEFRANPDVELFYPLDEAEKTVNGYGYSETDDSSGDAFKVASTSSYDPESEGTMQDTLSRNYNSSDQRRVPLLHNNITNSPADGAFDEDISNLDIQLLFSMQEDLEKTYQNYESSDNSIFGVPCEAVPVHSNVESEEAYHSAEQENSNSNVEAEEANYGAEQGNLIQKIGPSSGPVEGGGNFLITVSEELPDCIDSGFAYFGSNHAVLTKLNKFTFEGRIPAAQQPGVVRVCVYSDTNRFLGETDFEYEDMMDRVAFHAVQLGSEGVSKLYALMAKHSINMWNQSSSVKQISELSGQATGAMNDSCQERSSLAEDIVIADENDDLAQDLQDLINWVRVRQMNCQTEELTDRQTYRYTAVWIPDSPLSLPLVYTRLSKSQEANPKAESTQLLNKPVNIELDVSHGIPATVTEGFTSEPSIGDNKYVGSGDFLEWNTPSPESKKTKVNAVNEDQDTEQDLSQEWVFSSEEGTSCARLESQDDNSMLDLPGIDVDIKGSLYQDDELLKTPHTENAKSQNVELSLSITSMQKSATHDGPSTQYATQSPSKDPLQDGTGNRKSNVVPSQHSNKDITDNSGQEWAKSGTHSDAN